jgi:peptidyl-prolyl cis-trans isomerase C
MRDALLRQRVTDGTDDAGLQARFEELKKQPDFVHDEVHARHILVDEEAAAKQVITALEGGADFAEQAKTHSKDTSAAARGGDLGYFRIEQMVPEFGAAAFAMDKGQISKEPIKTQFGWHVIQVLDKRKVEPSFEETAPQLRQDMAREIVTALVTDLREGAKIERFNIDGSPMKEPPAAEGGAAAPAKPQQ